MRVDSFNDSSEIVAFEKFYLANYKALTLYILKLLNNSSHKYRSLSERASDIAQETFLTAWAKRRDWMPQPDPKRWLYATACNKVKETLRDENKWRKQLLAISKREPFSAERTFQLRMEMADILSPEEFKLLVWLYVEGYSYSEIAEKLNIKKSTLAMQVKRSKEKFQKSFKDINFQK